MRAVLTRVSHASVSVDGAVIGEITPGPEGGILALIGVSVEDIESPQRQREAVLKMADKIAHLRILEGELSATDAQAPILLISQFTLYGKTAKGRRPSWSQAAPGPLAAPVIQEVIAQLRELGLTVAEGEFGADMEVASVNQGPFTVLVDT